MNGAWFGRCKLTSVLLRLLDRLDLETGLLQREADSDVHRLLGTVSVEQYRRYLTETFGMVRPIERALARVEGLPHVLDPRRLRKHELLARDLEALGLKPSVIDDIPRCAIPPLPTVHEALGWVFVIEHSTLSHSDLFLQLALGLPGVAAFASSYLKCYFGAVGETWKSFCHDLEAATQTSEQADRVVQSVKSSYGHFRGWHRSQNNEAPAFRERSASQ